MVDSLGATRQTFDRMNRLVQVVDPFGQTVSNQYSLAGQRTKIVYPDGKSQTFACDSRNNLTGANLPGGLAAACSYDVANRPVL